MHFKNTFVTRIMWAHNVVALCNATYSEIQLEVNKVWT